MPRRPLALVSVRLMLAVAAVALLALPGCTCVDPGTLEAYACTDAGCVPAKCGGLCAQNPGPCKVGVVSCDTGACLDGAAKPSGSSCQLSGGRLGVCDDAANCQTCVPGGTCLDNPNPCVAGVQACTDAGVVCVDSAAPRAAGTECFADGGVNGVCTGQSACIACQGGAPCSGNPTPCRAGVLDCSSGAPRCLDDALQGAGTSCKPLDGGTGVCTPASECVACTEGGACTGNPTPCRLGSLTCSGGVPTCRDGATKPAGSSCALGSDAGVCSAFATCISCVAGSACATNPGAACRAGVLSCTGGSPTCQDSTARLPGTSCVVNGDAGVCTSGAACVPCLAGSACSGNPTACLNGSMACASGTPTCQDTSAARDAGTACTALTGPGVCTGFGACVACTAGGLCGTNPNLCKVGTVSCATGGPTCVDGTSRDAGSPCLTNNDAGVCTAAATCTPCLAGADCTTNPTFCAKGVVACGPTGPSCTDGAPKDAGTACTASGGPGVCSGSAPATCVSCSSGAACSTNPNGACRPGVLQCSSGTATCVDGPSVAPAGTSCGTNRLCDATGVCTTGLAAATFTTPGAWKVVVPSSSTSLIFRVWGGGGAGGTQAGAKGGGGACVYATYAPKPGEVLDVWVGEGGSGTGNGAGASWVWTADGGTLLAVAAGGGGGGSDGCSGCSSGGKGGAGGGTTGEAGGAFTGNMSPWCVSASGGGGGTSSSGGAGGTASGTGSIPCSGQPGAAGAGGLSTGGGSTCNSGVGANLWHQGGGQGNGGGGGGGAGLYGGGGAGFIYTYCAGGGGGGSSYASNAVTMPVLTGGSGDLPGNATDPQNGGAGKGGAENGSGANGRVVIQF